MFIDREELKGHVFTEHEEFSKYGAGALLRFTLT